MLPQPPESSPYPLGSSPQTLCLLTPHPAHSRALHPAAHSCPRPKPHCWLTSTSRSHPCPASRWCLPPPPTPHGLPVSTSLLLLPARAHIPPMSRGCTPLLLGTGSPHSTPMAFSLCQAPPGPQRPSPRWSGTSRTSSMAPHVPKHHGHVTSAGDSPLRWHAAPQTHPSTGTCPQEHPAPGNGTFGDLSGEQGAHPQGSHTTPRPHHSSPVSPPGRSQHVLV